MPDKTRTNSNNNSSNGKQGGSYNGSASRSDSHSGHLNHSAVHKPVPGKGGSSGKGGNGR